MVDTSQWQSPVGAPPAGLPPGVNAPSQMQGNTTAQPWAPQPGMPDWLIDAYQNGGGYTLTDDDLMMLANWMLTQQMQSQVDQTDYQNRYLDYLNNQLGLNEMELQTAQQQMEFQQGEYWNWYVDEYFPSQQEQERLKLETSQINAQSQQAIAGIQENIAGIEQQRARDYALAGAFQTEQARLATDAARYQYMQSLGVNPVRDPGSGYSFRGY